MINKSISCVSILTLNHKYPISTEHISVLYVLPKVAKYNETKSNMHWTINICKTFLLNIEIMYIIVSYSNESFICSNDLLIRPNEPFICSNESFICSNGLQMCPNESVIVVFSFCSRFLWTVLMLLCSTVMSYQIIDRILYYRSNPVNVNVKINYNQSLVFPAVTICNQNAFKYAFNYDRLNIIALFCYSMMHQK